jgi:hypothetical protein
MTSPKAKASENKGLKCGSEKKYLLSVNGYVKFLYNILFSDGDTAVFEHWFYDQRGRKYIHI